jgi:Metallo-beta-lactamase superfamily.
MNKPDNDEIEVSIFGTGAGECLAIHIGFGKWILIDSCYLSKNKIPLNIDYLKSLEYDLTSSVKLIICTHWHDDHAKGLSEIYKSIDAPIVVSIALQKREFLGLASTYKELNVPSLFSSGIHELSEIFRSKIEDNSKRIVFAVNNKREFVEISEGNHAVVEFLSPSDEDVAEAIRNFAKLTPVNKECIKCLPSINNDSCVVTLITILGDSILCGADKECSNSQGKGWQFIYENFKTQNSQRSSIFKIAHHGSENGDHECIWRGMLNENPFAILTPFFRSNLPKDADIDRINKQTNEAYSAGPKHSNKSMLDSPVKKFLHDIDMEKRICQINKDYGRVTLRRKTSAPNWTVSMHGSAYKIEPQSN